MVKSGFLAIVVVAVVALTHASGKPAEKGKNSAADDDPGLQGVWFLMRIDSWSGNQSYPLQKKKAKPKFDDRFIFNQDKFIMFDEPNGTFKVDASKDPKQIDFLDAKTGKPWTLGIYKIEGDTLTLCWETDTDRPPGFKVAMERKAFRKLTLIRQAPAKD